MFILNYAGIGLLGNDYVRALCYSFTAYEKLRHQSPGIDAVHGFRR